MITAFLPWPTSTCSTVLDDLKKIYVCTKPVESSVHHTPITLQYSLSYFPDCKKKGCKICHWNKQVHTEQSPHTIPSSILIYHTRPILIVFPIPRSEKNNCGVIDTGLMRTGRQSNQASLTSRAETNCRGRRVAFRSCVLLSKS